MEKRTLFRSLFFSIAAQAISLSVSLLTGLIVPRFIDEFQYAYWQMYILYVGYVGIFHFGLVDGLLLKYAQYDLKDINRQLFRSQFFALIAVDTVIAVVVSVIGSFLLDGPYRLVLLLVSVGIVTKNVFTFSCYFLQLTNEIKKYSILVIIHRLIYGVAILFLLLFGVNDFVYYCVCDLASDILVFVVAFLLTKDVYFGHLDNLKAICKEYVSCISCGVLLLIANWSSNLILGSSKMIVQSVWGDLVFGKISFSFSLSNFFLTFVSAISIVLFPTLKRIGSEESRGLYVRIRQSLSPILFVILVFYFPGSIIISRWIPQYSESLIYLGILLPLIVYSTKSSLIFNNYFKSLRKEKTMLAINLFSVCLAVIMYLLSSLLLNSIDLVVHSCLIVLVVRSLISEMVIQKYLMVNHAKDIVIELIMTILFVVCARYLDFWLGFSLYSVAAVLYFGLFFKKIIPLFRKKSRIL